MQSHQNHLGTDVARALHLVNDARSGFVRGPLVCIAQGVDAVTVDRGCRAADGVLLVDVQTVRVCRQAGANFLVEERLNLCLGHRIVVKESGVRDDVSRVETGSRQGNCRGVLRHKQRGNERQREDGRDEFQQSAAKDHEHSPLSNQLTYVKFYPT